jgi:hypothetical protein
MCSLDGRSGTNKGGLTRIVVDKKKEETCAGEDQSRPLLRRGKTSKLGRSIIRRIKTRGIDTKTGVMFADSGSIACY